MNKIPFEVIVVGSGATGGVAAKVFAEKGVKVLLVEAGPNFSSTEALGSAPINSLKRIKSLLNGQHRIQAQHPGFWKANPSLYMNEKENPYQFNKNKPFIWTQGRQVGGRSLTWGGITLRLSDKEFKASEIDDYQPSWPISYKDLSNHYSNLEKELDIYGNKDGLGQIPDGDYKKELQLNSYEVDFAKKIKNKLGYNLIQSRGFKSYSPKSDGPWPLFSSQGSSLRKALSTGNVEILDNHIVERIITNKDKSVAKGIIVIDRKDGSRKELNCKLIVLCASTIQTIKILLNSKEEISERGLIEPSGTLGNYLMDHISVCRFFTLPNPLVIKNKALSEEQKILSGAGSFFIPFGNELPNGKDVDFLRGYGIWGGIDRFGFPDWLNKLKGPFSFLIAHGEVLPRESNNVTLSKKLDKWGVAQPHINFEWSENEKRMSKHMASTIKQIIEASDGELLPIENFTKAPIFKGFFKNLHALNNQAPPPGYYVHEVGGARMGTNEKNSVVDKWNRLWRCQNVLVVDGACWPTSGWQSPTLTMMAITRRACLKAIKDQNG